MELERELVHRVSGHDLANVSVDPIGVGAEYLLLFGVEQPELRIQLRICVAYVAEDRLWQLELNRRAARGKLAEILGSSALASDRSVRTVGYTDAELDAQFHLLNTEEQEIFSAYADGINRYVSEVVAADPLNKLPFEFHALGIGVPTPWTLRDSVAFGAFAVRRFGEIEGGASSPTSRCSLLSRRRMALQLSPFDILRRHTMGKRPGRTGHGNRHPAPSGSVEKSDPRPTSGRDRRVAGPAGRRGTRDVAGARHSHEAWQLRLGGRRSEKLLADSPCSTAALRRDSAHPSLCTKCSSRGGNGFKVTGMAFAGVVPVLIGRTGITSRGLQRRPRAITWTTT